MTSGVKERKGIFAILGDVGTGKTTLLNTLLKDLKDKARTAFILNPRLTFEQLLKGILADLQVSVTGNSTDILLHRFDLYLQKRSSRDETVLIIIDEAQNLSTKVLEDLGRLFQRQTLSAKLLQIILAGQLELEDNLNSEGSRQLNRRIALHHRLSPLSREESKAYIDHRLKIVGSGISEVFTPEAVDLICDVAKGVPRVINMICDRAFLAGYSLTSPKIGMMIAKEVIREGENIAQEVTFDEKKTTDEREPWGSMDYHRLQEPARYWKQGSSDGRGVCLNKKGIMRIVQDGKKFGPPATSEPINISSRLYTLGFLALCKSLKEKYIDLEVKKNLLQEEGMKLTAQIAKKETELKAIQASMKIEEEQRIRTEKILRLMEEQLQYLSSEFLDLQEKDKKFIAGDLLSVMTSLILSLKSGVEDILLIMKGESDAALINFEPFLYNLQNGVQKVEEILVRLYPSTLDDSGILSAMGWYCQKFQKYHPQFQVAQEIDVQEEEIGDPVKKQLFRILQGALDLIAEHSKGDRVYVSISRKDGKLFLKVEENGQGFDLHKLFSKTNGVGLARMKQRAELSGGYLSIESGEALGTSIRASWPM